MKLFKILILALCTCVLDVNAQIDKGEFKKKFSDAEYHMLYENYSLALPIYLELLKSEPNNANINYKIGFCYLKSSIEKLKSIPFLEVAIKNADKDYMEFEPTEERAPLLAHFYLGTAYHLNYQFADAIKSYEKYLSLINKRSKEEVYKTENQIAMCKNGIDLMKNPTNVIITGIGDSINSKYPDYGALISVDESVMIYTSRREGSTGENLTLDGQFFEDIYIANKVNGVWGKGNSIGTNINTIGHEATIGLSADGQQLLIYKDDNGDGNIYLSHQSGTEWSKPELLGSDINTKAWEPSACFSSDGNTIFFVSDRKGGYGGRDIYRSVKLPTGQWSQAINLGPNINSPYDEDAPFMHPDDKTLFFSSNGHRTMGGFDIFFSTRSGETTWSFPTNIGYPINTTDDDIFYVTSADGKRAYYSSIKEGGMGEKDIYMISLPEATTKPLTVLVGKITNPDREDITNNLITITDVKGKIPPTTYRANSKTGKYVLTLIPGTSYKLDYTINGKQIHSEVIDVPEGSEYQMLQREINLKPVEVTSKDIAKEKEAKKDTTVTEKEKPGAIAAIEEFEIFFNYNNKNIKPDDPKLLAFVETIASKSKGEKKPVIQIEASASKVPTSKFGSNEKLAQARGEAAKQELLTALDKRGIAKDRVTIKISPKVQGPTYNNDFIENRARYEKFQYIKMTIK